MDKDGNCFIFCNTVSGTGVFALAKRMDLPSALAAIQNGMFDSVIRLDDGIPPCSLESCGVLSSIASNCEELLAMNNNIPFMPCISGSQYILSNCGLSLFFSFLSVIPKEMCGVEIQADKEGYAIISATVKAANADELAMRLELLQDIMDTQNLNLAYSRNGDEIKIAFLPYYIDDGLYGVKSTIEILKFL